MAPRSLLRLSTVFSGFLSIAVCISGAITAMRPGEARVRWRYDLPEWPRLKMPKFPLETPRVREMKYLLDSLAAAAMLSVVATAASQEADVAGPAFCNHELEQTFSLEDRDSAWAETAEGALFSHIAQASGLALTGLLVQCRETVCRLQFMFPTDEYQHEYGNSLVADAVDSAPGFVKDFGRIVLGTNEEPTVEYYLKRDGVCVTRPVKG